jgi:hypothetical protein
MEKQYFIEEVKTECEQEMQYLCYFVNGDKPCFLFANLKEFVIKMKFIFGIQDNQIKEVIDEEEF